LKGAKVSSSAPHDPGFRGLGITDDARLMQKFRINHLSAAGLLVAVAAPVAMPDRCLTDTLRQTSNCFKTTLRQVSKYDIDIWQIAW
jgi:hypothetical protein